MSSHPQESKGERRVVGSTAADGFYKNVKILVQKWSSITDYLHGEDFGTRTIHTITH